MPALFPEVPIHRGALRFTVTAANIEEQVWSAIEVLGKVSARLWP
jgi:7-keto-8-aminopelargonate synthetase-like enzyme